MTIRSVHAAATAALLLALTTSFNAWAYRPFDGTDADVAETGFFELELGPVHWYSQGGRHSLLAPATVLNLGYAPRLELVVDFENSVSLDSSAAGPRDSTLGTDVLTKLVVVPGVLQGVGSGPSFALETGVLLPSVNAERGFGGSCDAIVSEQVAGLTIHVNTWLELTRDVLHLDWFEGVIVEGDSHSRARPVSEWFVERDFVDRSMTYSGLVGGIWRARDDLDLDFGLREASLGGQRVSEVRVGLTWTLNVWTSTGNREWLPASGNR